MRGARREARYRSQCPKVRSKSSVAGAPVSGQKNRSARPKRDPTKERMKAVLPRSGPRASPEIGTLTEAGEDCVRNIARRVFYILQCLKGIPRRWGGS